MKSSFFGLEIAKRALFTSQYALNMTSHNIANANTEGYSRQQAIFSSTHLNTYGFYGTFFKGQVGSGVTVDEVRRVRDIFVDYDFRNENQDLGEWEVKSDFLQKIELIFNEPSDTGIRSVLDNFWGAFQELSKDPANPTIREIVYSEGENLAETLNSINKKLLDLEEHVNFTLETKIDDINSLSRQIAELNLKIQQVEITGDNANDMRDKRGLLIDRLSKIVNINVTEHADGQITITIAGMPLVQGVNHKEMEFDKSTEPPQVIWDKTGAEVDIDSGELKGLLDIRDNIIAQYKQNLREIADALIYKINRAHKFGYDLNGDKGEDFFLEGSGEELLVMNPLLENVEKIAAASSPDGIPGDGTNALEMAQLENYGFGDPYTVIKIDGIDLNSNNLVVDKAAGEYKIKIIYNGEEVELSWKNDKVYDGSTNTIEDFADDLQELINENEILAGNVVVKGIDNAVLTIVSDKSVEITNADSDNIILNPLNLSSKTTFDGNYELYGEVDYSFPLDVNGGGITITYKGTPVNLTLDNTVYDGSGDSTNLDALVEDIMEKIEGTALENHVAVFNDDGYIRIVSDDEFSITNNGMINFEEFLGIPDGSSGETKLNDPFKGTIDDFTKSLISRLGVQTQEAKRNVDNQALLISHLENRREMASGVSIDEEMSNMVKFQHAYTAAARLVTAIDEMIGIVVERMGVVGR